MTDETAIVVLANGTIKRLGCDVLAVVRAPEHREEKAT